MRSWIAFGCAPCATSQCAAGTRDTSGQARKGIPAAASGTWTPSSSGHGSSRARSRPAATAHLVPSYGRLVVAALRANEPIAPKRRVWKTARLVSGCAGRASLEQTEGGTDEEASRSRSRRQRAGRRYCIGCVGEPEAAHQWGERSWPERPVHGPGVGTADVLSEPVVDGGAEERRWRWPPDAPRLPGSRRSPWRRRGSRPTSPTWCPSGVPMARRTSARSAPTSTGTSAKKTPKTIRSSPRRRASPAPPSSARRCTRS
jgi:hypothetical protein